MLKHKKDTRNEIMKKNLWRENICCNKMIGKNSGSETRTETADQRELKMVTGN